jgi:two-component system response regulator MprA
VCALRTLIHKEKIPKKRRNRRLPDRILVIDDETKIVDFIRRGLKYEGYEVDSAYDGLSGLAQARNEPPDLIILDIMMPGLDGLEVCRRLRAEGWTELPILMLTARS